MKYYNRLRNSVVLNCLEKWFSSPEIKETRGTERKRRRNPCQMNNYYLDGQISRDSQVN